MSEVKFVEEEVLGGQIQTNSFSTDDSANFIIHSSVRLMPIEKKKKQSESFEFEDRNHEIGFGQTDLDFLNGA